MRPIEKYVEAMENKDFAGLAELFTPDGILCDYCTTSASQQEYQDSLSAQNREYAYNLAMTMLAAGVMPDTNFGGYNIMAIATVRETDENGRIQRLTVRPK